MNYIFWLDILGTIVFAISGVLLASKTHMDPIGALVLGVITAIGGGTIRDIILNNGPIFWFTDSTDLVVALLTSAITIVIIRYTYQLRYPKLIFSVVDAIGLAVFVGIGINKAIDANANGLIAICMGVMTGVGGGVLRDVLAREIPMVFKTDIYATACIIGGTVHILAINTLNLHQEVATTCGIVATLAIRLSAIYWHLQLPTVGARSIKTDNSTPKSD